MKFGYYKNNMNGEMNYKSFYPTPLQEIETIEFDARTIELLALANFELGRLNGLASNIVDIDMFLGKIRLSLFKLILLSKKKSTRIL